MPVPVSDADFLRILRSVGDTHHDILLRKYRKVRPDLLSGHQTYTSLKTAEQSNHRRSLKLEAKMLNRRLHTPVIISFLPKRITGDLFSLECTLDGLVYDRHVRYCVNAIRVSSVMGDQTRRATVPVTWLVKDCEGVVLIEDWQTYDRLVNQTSLYRCADWMDRLFLPA